MIDYQYYAIFLTEDSKKRLMSAIASMDWGYDYLYEETSKVYCDHCTIMHKSKHNIYVQETLERHLNDSIIIEVTHIGSNDNALAVKVAREGSIAQLCTNNTPHITVGTFVGGKPVDSNYIDAWRKLYKPILLVGTLKRI